MTEETREEIDSTQEKEQEEATATVRPPDPPKFINLAEEEDVDLESPEILELLAMYEETLGDLNEGTIVHGKIISVGEKDVLVDIGFKSEGVINLAEFSDPSEVNAGDEVEVYLERMENGWSGGGT